MKKFLFGCWIGGILIGWLGLMNFEFFGGLKFFWRDWLWRNGLLLKVYFWWCFNFRIEILGIDQNSSLMYGVVIELETFLEIRKKRLLSSMYVICLSFGVDVIFYVTIHSLDISKFSDICVGVLKGCRFFLDANRFTMYLNNLQYIDFEELYKSHWICFSFTLRFWLTLIREITVLFNNWNRMRSWLKCSRLWGLLLIHSYTRQSMSRLSEKHSISFNEMS